MIFGYQNDKSEFSITCKFLRMNSSIPMVLILWTQLISNSTIWKLIIYCIVAHYVLFLNSFWFRLIFIIIHHLFCQIYHMLSRIRTRSYCSLRLQISQHCVLQCLIIVAWLKIRVIVFQAATEVETSKKNSKKSNSEWLKTW